MIPKYNTKNQHWIMRKKMYHTHNGYKIESLELVNVL